MELSKPFGGQDRRLTEGEIVDRRPHFVRLDGTSSYEGPSLPTSGASVLNDGDDGIRPGEQIRVELAELLEQYDDTKQ